MLHNLAESCNNCRVADLEWEPYYDELRLRWLLILGRENRITPAQKLELELLNEKIQNKKMNTGS
jgi:hypothetical protein